MQAGVFLMHLREFIRDDSGAIAIEAAIIFPVGFLLVMGTLEMALYFFANSALNNAVKEMAYEAAQECKADEKEGVYPAPVKCKAGSIKDGSTRAQDLEKILITYSGGLIQLDPSKLCIQVHSVVPAGLSGNLGGSGQIMRYDFMYRWQFLTPLIGKFFGEVLQFNASFLVRNGEIQDPANRQFTWMQGSCSEFAAVK